MISELKNWGLNVIVDDPCADRLEVQENFNITLEKIDIDNKVDSLIVAVGHDEFRKIDPETLRSFCNGNAPVLADVKSLFDKDLLEKQNFTVFRL